MVAAIHPLSAAPGFDVSHSQPKWPDKIFVSFPERDDELGRLRLAESIVHEAMHLHLTMEELRYPLVAKSERELYSPWQATLRPAQGVLHGLFVFYCIKCFLSRIEAEGSLVEDARRHIFRRLLDIELEIVAVDLPALTEALTPRGAALVQTWTNDLADRRVVAARAC